jgi:nucleoside-diphosphate-sugar epimerase
MWSGREGVAEGNPMDLIPESRFSGALALVTGGGGFIGSHLADALLDLGAHVRVLDNFSTGRRSNLAHLAGRIDLQEGDIRDVAACERACAGVQFVFHEAALGSVPRSMEDPATSLEVNASGTANIFSAARNARVERVVFASSSSVYGDSAALPKREGDEGRPLSPYALSKVMDEQLGELFGRCFGMQLIGLRYFNVYGPRQDPDGPYAAVIPRFFKAYLRKEAPVIYGDGGQSRDFTFVQDVVDANLKAAAAPEGSCGRSYNVAGGVRITVNDLALAVRDVLGGGPEPSHTEPRPGDIRHSLADLSHAGEQLGFFPRVSMDEGLARSKDYYAATMRP